MSRGVHFALSKADEARPCSAAGNSASRPSGPCPTCRPSRCATWPRRCRSSGRLRRRYDALGDTDYAGPMDEDDFDYTWSNLEDVREFFAAAAEAERAVIFTDDT